MKKSTFRNRSESMKKGSSEWVLGRKGVLLLVISTGFFAMGFFIHGNIGFYFNLAALLIVFGGTLAATFISFRVERLILVYRVLYASYRAKLKMPDEIVQILVDLSVKSKIRGMLSLQEDEKETSLLALRHALGYLVDGYSGNQIRDILNTEMYFFKVRREDSERVLRSMADIAPCFGLVGSMVGLIGMIAGLEDTSIILKTIPIVLTSTLYGVILANLFLLPFAENIRTRTEQELLLQKIIMEGVIAIGSELHPRVLEMRLKSFLTPSSRRGKLVSLEKIQQMFQIKSDSEAGVEWAAKRVA